MGAPGNLVHVGSQREWPWPEYPRLGRGFLQGAGVSKNPEAQTGTGRRKETRQHPRARSQGGKWGNKTPAALLLDLGRASSPHRCSCDGHTTANTAAPARSSGCRPRSTCSQSCFLTSSGHRRPPKYARSTACPQARSGHNTVNHCVEAIPPQFCGRVNAG